MIRSLSINEFRGFEHFELCDLGRINLLVGSNNCGKTSILEAIQLYAGKSPAPLLQIATRRGEIHMEGSESHRRYDRMLDISHLFHGHQIYPGASFDIAATTDAGKNRFTAQITEDKNRQVGKTEPGLDELESNLVLELSWVGGETEAALSVNVEGSIRVGSGAAPGLRSHKRTNGADAVCIFSGGLDVEDVVNMFESVVLNPEEDLVTRALRTIEPTIERLATVSSDRPVDRYAERGGIVVRCEGVEGRVPIGSMGDGMWRMLGLALALVSAKNGILLVDEIDTGLHFTVMEEMWKLVHSAARDLGVQVFATTHSRDAYESLAGIARSCEFGSREVTIQRIDLEKGSSVVFDEREIVAAAEHGTEVR